MKKIKLIDELEYKREYREIKDAQGNIYLDGDNYRYWQTTLEKTVYEADELVELDTNLTMLLKNIVDSYINVFHERKLQLTQEQIDFAKQTAMVLLGKLKNENTIPVIPAPCGFGKSTITQIFIEEICKAYKDGILEEGIIIVTDKIDQLNELHNSIKSNKEIGLYNESEKGKTTFTYVLEGWKEDSFDRGVCLNKSIKVYEYGMCSKKNCTSFGECKISKQRNIQLYSPILLMTNARLETFGEGLNKYSTYIDKDGETQSRSMRINDEKPSMRDSMTININILQEIKKSLYRIENIEDRRILIDKFIDIQNLIEDKFRQYEAHERIFVPCMTNEPILLRDSKLVQLWDQYMGNKFKNELRQLQAVLTGKGGLYSNTIKNSIFINTIGMKNIVNEKMKTIIFDGTALIDPDYANEEVIKFVDIKNPRTFENVTFNFYRKHRLNKGKFGDVNYLSKACATFLETINKNELTYVVTHSTVSSTIMDEIKKSSKIKVVNPTYKGFGTVNIISEDEDKLYYFGNTKGSNAMKNCKQMVQLGYNILPDYEYITRYLCTNYSHRDDIFEKCRDIEIAEKFINYIKNSDDLRLYKNYSILTDFIQEVFRTKLRQCDCNDNITVHCFQTDGLLIKMIQQMFPRCKVNEYWDTLDCFMEEKILGRNTETPTVAQKIIKWIKDEWNGEEIRTKNMLSEIGINQKQFDKAKENNSDLKEILDKHMIKRGIYKKAS